MWLFTGCIDRIPLETEGEVDLLVIEGSINNGPGPYTITISRSGDFSEDQLGIAQPVTGADVQIVAGTGEFSIMTETAQGLYQTTDLSFRGEVGNDYHLEATLANGKTYQSFPEKLLPVPPVNEVTFETFKEDELSNNNVILEKDFIRFLVNTRLPDDPENRYLKWDFFGEYVFTEIGNPGNPLDPIRQCYIPENIGLNRVVIFNGTEANDKDLTEEVFIKELDDKFRTTYCFHIYQQSLTRGAYEFWEEVETLINRTGSLFEVPPGKVNGNIINANEHAEKVLGYFQASSIDTLRFFVRRSAIQDVDIGNACNNADPELLSACFNCLFLPNSTLDKPPYWEN